MNASLVTASPPSRAQQIHSFLQQNNLQAWISWRPDDLVMLSGYFPFWGASLLINFVDAEPVLFVPKIEPRDHIPAGLQVQEYPWGDMKCSDPYAVLASIVGDALLNAKVRAKQAGMSPSASRISLPIQAAEQIPMPENFAGLLSDVASQPNALCLANFAKLYSRKTAEETQAIRLANRVASIGLQAFFNNLQAGIAEAEIGAAAQALAAYFTHHTGHHVGFRYHDPGFGILPGESSVLEPGMIITIEPGVYVPERGAGARIEDNVLVTESGHEILSRKMGSEEHGESGRDNPS